MRRSVLVSILAALAVAPSTALAQQPVAPPAPAPAPVQATLTLAVEHVGGKLATTLVGTSIRVRGTVATFVADQQVKLRFSYDGKRIRTKTATLRPGPDGSGIFLSSYRAERSGRLVVRAAHAATPALDALAATSHSVDVIPRSVGPKSRKRAVRALQRRLSRLGYVVGSRGNYDDRTARAVLAFRKVTGMARTTDASVTVMRRIARGGGRFKVRHPEHGRHVEADLTRQVMALISAGRAQRVYPISSGKPSTPTILGSFRVYSKTPGINQKGMVDSAYFIRGYATHGYASVPIYPASHGCLRTPVPDARNIFNWITIGTPVDVYYGPNP
jgi:peptidoglycan hydrolase-like protein with peptidoglycan-binding domain